MENMEVASEVQATWEISDENDQEGNEEELEEYTKDESETFSSGHDDPFLDGVDVDTSGIDSSFDDELSDMVNSNLNINNLNMLDINMDLTDAVAEDIATGNIDSSSDSGISSGGEDDAHITEIG